MTCAPNALQSGVGLRMLQPQETFSSQWGISLLRPAKLAGFLALGHAYVRLAGSLTVSKLPGKESKMLAGEA